MPLERCGNNSQGWRWGQSGKCYIGTDARMQALRQGRATFIAKSPYKDEYANLLFDDKFATDIEETLLEAEKEPNAIALIKAAPKQKMVFGWANVSLKADGNYPFDWDLDQTAPEELEKAAYMFVLKYRVAGTEHTGGVKGYLIESLVFTKEKMDAMGIPEGVLPVGWWVGFYIPDEEVFNKVISGDYSMFSVQGTGQRVPID